MLNSQYEAVGRELARSNEHFVPDVFLLGGSILDAEKTSPDFVRSALGTIKRQYETDCAIKEMRKIPIAISRFPSIAPLLGAAKIAINAAEEHKRNFNFDHME